MRLSKRSKLTTAEKQFCKSDALHGNKSKAVIEAMPEKSLTSSSNISMTSSKLLGSIEIQQEVQRQRQRLTLLSNSAIDKLETIINSGRERNALDASTFVIEQSIGKAVTPVEVKQQTVTLNIDLSGVTDNKNNSTT